MKHADQRTPTLDKRHDQLFQKVEVAEQPTPEPIPVPDAEESDWGAFIDAVEDSV